jgi:cytochrome c oxidase subunit IV
MGHNLHIARSFCDLSSTTEPTRKGFQKSVGWLFVLSSIANIVWLFLWQFEYLGFSVVVIFLLLATLILIYLRLNIGKSKVPSVFTWVRLL